MRFVGGVFSVFLCICMPGGANADLNQHRRGCEKSFPRSAISSCTWLLNSGKLPNTDIPKVYHVRGYHYLRVGQSFGVAWSKRAVRDFSSALRMNPKQWQSYRARGRVFLQWGRYKLAIADFTKAISLNPSDVSSHFWRAHAYEALGRYYKALADYGRTVEYGGSPTYSTDSTAHARRSMASIRQILARARATIKKSTQKLRESGDNAASYFRRALAYNRLGSQRLALIDYGKVIELEPRSELGALAYNNRAWIHFVAGALRRGLAEANQAIDLNADANFFHTRASIHLALGNAQLARQDIEEGLRISSNSQDLKKLQGALQLMD